MEARVSPLMKEMLQQAKNDPTFRDDLFKALLGRTKQVKYNGVVYTINQIKEKTNDN